MRSRSGKMLCQTALRLLYSYPLFHIFTAVLCAMCIFSRHLQNVNVCWLGRSLSFVVLLAPMRLYRTVVCYTHIWLELMLTPNVPSQPLAFMSMQYMRKMDCLCVCMFAGLRIIT